MILNRAVWLKLLWLKFHWPDLHLDLLQRVVRPVPAVPGDPIRVLHVLTVAVKNAIQVGVSAAVVPVAPCGDASEGDSHLKQKVKIGAWSELQLVRYLCAGRRSDPRICHCPCRRR